MTVKVKNVEEGQGNRHQRRAAAAVAGKTEAPASAPPAPEVVAGITIVTDERGRRIGLKKLNAVERFELDDVVEGKTLSSSMTIKLVASVRSIDDEGMTPITSREELHERLTELGDDGLQAITEVGLKMYGFDLSELEKQLAKK